MKISQVILKPESRTFTAVQFLLHSSPAAPGWDSESPPQQSQQSASEGSCLRQTAGQTAFKESADQLYKKAGRGSAGL